MSRPTSKALLVAECEKERQALEDFLATLTSEDLTRAGMLGDWSAKDTLAHLIAWEQMVLDWLAASHRGETPEVPAPGYKWNQIPALNEEIRQSYAPRPLEEITRLFRESYQQIRETIDGLSEEVIFTPGLYPWMNKNTLAAYFNSATSSHYRWARQELRKGFKKAK